MDERYDPNLLLDYVEGELPDDARQRVEALLADDPKLAELVRGMQQDRAALRAADPGEVPRDLVAGGLAKVEREMLLDDDPAVPSPTVAAPVHRWRIGPLLTYGGIAAVLALTATVVLQSLQSESNPAPLATGDALAMREEAAGVGLAEAPLEAQRQAAAADESLALGSEKPDTTDGVQLDLLADAIAAVERSATAPDRDTSGGFGGFYDASGGTSSAGPATDLSATDLFASVAPRRAGFPVSGAPVPLAPAEARYQVNVYTRSAELTRRDLEDWAYDNRVAIAEEAVAPSFQHAEASPPASPHTAAKSAPAAATPIARSQKMGRHERVEDRARFAAVAEANQAIRATNQQLVLTLDQRQVDDLVYTLNRDNLRQNAIVLDHQTPTRTFNAAVAGNPRPVTSALQSEGSAANDAATVGRASGMLAEVEEDAESRSDFELTESLNDVPTNVPADADAVLSTATRPPAAAGERYEWHTYLYRGEAPRLGLDQNVFFEFSPSPAPLPWLQWTQPPAPPVLVQVVIEETPATPPPPAFEPSSPAEPASSE